MTAIDATEAEIRAVAEVLKFAAILDDRAPSADKARIAAWAEQVHRHQLGRDDLVDGLRAFYDIPHDRAISIGDLIHHARQIRRDRTEREDAEAAARRQQWRDERAADEVHSIAAVAITGPTNRTAAIDAAEIALQTCVDKQTALAAIRQYFAAKTEAKGTKRNGQNQD